MRVVDLIEKKRDKKELSKEEISFLLNEYLKENTVEALCGYGTWLEIDIGQ